MTTFIAPEGPRRKTSSIVFTSRRRNAIRNVTRFFHYLFILGPCVSPKIFPRPFCHSQQCRPFSFIAMKKGRLEGDCEISIFSRHLCARGRSLLYKMLYIIACVVEMKKARFSSAAEIVCHRKSVWSNKGIILFEMAGVCSRFKSHKSVKRQECERKNSNLRIKAWI